MHRFSYVQQHTKNTKTWAAFRGAEASLPTKADPPSRSLHYRRTLGKFAKYVRRRVGVEMPDVGARNFHISAFVVVAYTVLEPAPFVISFAKAIELDFKSFPITMVDIRAVDHC